MYRGGNMPCIVNAANEMVVAAFLRDEIGFLAMSDVIEQTMGRASFVQVPTYDDYVAMKNDKGEPKYKIVSDGSSTANMSAKELGKYVRPYSIVKATNAVFDGYTFAKAYYL